MSSRSVRRRACSVALLGALTAMPLTLPSTAAAAPTPGPQQPTVLPGLQVPPPRGSVPVGQASYPVPANAVHVAPWGSDSNNGTAGAPMRTVGAAVWRVPWGGTLVLRGGTYHERVHIGRPMTIQNYPGETVWFDGSIPATGWWASGSGRWTTGYSIRHDHGTPASNDPFVGSQNPMAAWPDMLFVDGQQLWQVAADPGPGQFSVDYSAGTVTIGTDPTGKDVRVSDLEETLVVGADDVTIQGIGIRRVATPLNKPGALFLARKVLVRNVVVEDAATVGIASMAEDKNSAAVLDSVTVARAGLLGVSATQANDFTLRNSLINESNLQKFNVTPSSAGVKVTRSRGITIDNNQVSNSLGATGIWTDESVVYYRISRNKVVNNGHVGIEAELSSTGIIAGNVVADHDYGVFLFDAENTIVANNTISGNTKMDLQLLQDFRRQANPDHNGHDYRYPIPDSENTWLLRDIRVWNNVFAAQKPGAIYQFMAYDRDTNRPADSMNIHIGGNAFYAAGQKLPWTIGWGTTGGRWTDYGNPTDWARAKARPDTNVVSWATDARAMENEVWNNPKALPMEPSVAQALGAGWAINVIGSPIH